MFSQITVIRKSFFIACIILMMLHCRAQQTVGLFVYEPATFQGYTLFAPLSYTSTYLIDNCGKLVHEWTGSYRPGNAVYLLPNTLLLRTGTTPNPVFQMGGRGGIIELVNQQNQVIWSFQLSNDTLCLHHDVEYLPNGNILAIAWDKKNPAEAFNQGRNPALTGTSVWSERIIEICPDNDSIVWQWCVWNHLIQDFDSTKNNYGIISEHPERININFTTGHGASADWLHINSVDYNPNTDEILLSVHNFSEIWIIDHSTTTAEASTSTGGNSGKGGDLLFRWGNPAAYNKGDQNNQMFFFQHDAHWIEDGLPDAGKIMVFNNGLNRPGGAYSSVEIIAPVTDINGNYLTDGSGVFLPQNLYYQYTAPVPGDFYSSNISGAQLMPNGNILVCEGDNGIFFEIDSLENIVWKYINPVSIDGPISQGDIPGGTPPAGNPNQVFKIQKFEVDFPGFAGLDLTPGDPVELNPLPDSCVIFSSTPELNLESIVFFPNPVSEILTIQTPTEVKTPYFISIHSVTGKTLFSDTFSAGGSININVSDYLTGIYFLEIETSCFHLVYKVSIIH